MTVQAKVKYVSMTCFAMGKVSCECVRLESWQRSDMDITNVSKDGITPAG